MISRSSAYGPNRVVQGHDLYVQEVSAITDGTRDYAYYFVDGLPTDLIHAFRIAGLLGYPNPMLYARSVDFVLGMIDQMFISNTDPYLKPFMVGLMQAQPPRPTRFFTQLG